MNNKGFAITGVLYTTMILFLLILISILASLSSKNNLLKKSVESIENEFVGKEITDNTTIEKAKTDKIAPVTGKYVFVYDLSGTKVSCYSFIKKGGTLNTQDNTNFIFTTDDCNIKRLTIDNFELKTIYSFE